MVNNGATGGDAGWVAEVTCVTRPESDLVLVSPEPFPGTPDVGVCMDELVTFDASGSVEGDPNFPLDSLVGTGAMVRLDHCCLGWIQSHTAI